MLEDCVIEVVFSLMRNLYIESKCKIKQSWIFNKNCRYSCTVAVFRKEVQDDAYYTYIWHRT